MSSTKTIAILLACAGLAGCLPANGHLSSDFGAALSQNLAAQVADPDAVYERALEPASNGQRAADAGDRYARGQVTPPITQSASTVGTQSGGGGGAGAGAAATK